MQQKAEKIGRKQQTGRQANQGRRSVRPSVPVSRHALRTGFPAEVSALQTASRVDGGFGVMLYVTLTTPGTSEVSRLAKRSSFE